MGNDHPSGRGAASVVEIVENRFSDLGRGGAIRLAGSVCLFAVLDCLKEQVLVVPFRVDSTRSANVAHHSLKVGEITQTILREFPFRDLDKHLGQTHAHEIHERREDSFVAEVRVAVLDRFHAAAP